MKLNRNGNNRVVTSFEENQGWVLPLDSKNLEDRYFLKNNDGLVHLAPTVAYLYGMTSKFLNFSKLERDTMEARHPSLTICLHCDIPSSVFRQVKVILLFVNVESLAYCETGSLLRETDMVSVVFTPFDLLTWVVLLVTLVALMFIPYLSFWKVADLVWLMMSQPPQQRKPILLIISISIVLTVIQMMYLSYFTSDIVKPFDKVYIDTNQELFDSGYRMVVIDNVSLSEFAGKYTNEKIHSLLKLSLDFENMEQYYLDSDEAKESGVDVVQLALTRNEGAIAFYRKFEKQYLMDAESRASGINCHMLKEPWDVQRVTVYFKGHLAEPFYTYFGNLISAGIFQFWEMAYISLFNRRIGKTVKEKLMQGEEKLETASLKTSLKSFFKLCLVLISIDVTCFVIEIFTSWNVIIELANNVLLKFKLLYWYWKNRLTTTFYYLK